MIVSALRMIGQLAPGRGPSVSEANEALFVLNRMLEAWSVERLVVHQVARDTYTLTPGLPVHTIGAGGTFDAARPVRIENAGVLLAGSTVEVPIQVIRDPGKWAAVSDKASSGTPAVLYPEGSFPLMRLNLAPVPASAQTLALYVWRKLSSIATTADELSFPEGYSEAITYNLAVKLAMEWARTPQRPVATPLVIDEAVRTKAAIKSLNMPSVEMTCDAGFPRSWAA
jgi:hypothetical protein